MQISEQWLRKWINPSIDSEKLAEALTMLGLEVDSVRPAAPHFKLVVVGEVKSVEQHPNADRLKFCKVDIAEPELVEVVCGGVNVRKGLKVAFVKVGGELPDGFQIKKAKLRGVESFGMICSAKELQIGEDEAGFILELPADAPVGQDFRQYFQLDDKIIDIDLTPNRGDCASILGLARDLSAKFNLTIHSPKIEPIKAVNHNKLKIHIAAKEACPRYVGRVINNINAKALIPIWMQERLRRGGIRSINPIVDISNYVMLELGQPTHVFDLDKLTGTITIRYAKKDKKITLLDNEEVVLDDKILVVADDKHAQAIAGVKGGRATLVDESTKNIFLESAYFNSTQIFKASHQINTSTDSSYRFERGVDYELQVKAAERFTQLILEICGGEPGPIVEVVEKNVLPVAPIINLRRSQIKRLLGIEVNDKAVECILIALGMKVSSTKEGWSIVVPSYRFDVTLEADLIEEVIRIYGYDQLKPTRMMGELKVSQYSINSNLPFLRLHQLLTDLGFFEAITYSFVDPNLQKLFDPNQQFLTLANPFSTEISVMRTSLWPGLVQALQYNLNRQVERLRLFETGLCFIKEGKELKQTPKVAGLIAGLAFELQWGSAVRKTDFFDIKGVVEQLFLLTHQENSLVWKGSTHPALHPGKSSDVYIGDTFVGSFGALHPQVVDSIGLSTTPYVFELDLIKISTVLPVTFNLISKYPAVRRDLAIVVDEGISAITVIQNVRDFAGQLLRDVRIFDIYQGEGIESGKKSIAMGLSFQDSARTLVDQEINEAVDLVVSGLEDKLKATLRA